MNSPTPGLFSRTLDRVLGNKRQSSRRQRRQAVRRSILEQLENRQLFALNILSVTPADGTTDAQIDTDLVIEFDQAPVIGQGNIHVVEADNGTLGIPVDVNSGNVTVNGNSVEVDLPVDLEWETNYFVLIDDGAFKDASTTLFADSTLLIQDFELLPLLPFQTESGGDGTDFTLDPPLGFEIDNSNMIGPGTPEWQGWSFADKDSWIDADNQSRDQFTLGTGTVAIADPDEWDDQYAGTDAGTNFNSILESKPILLDGVTANTLKLEFDSSYRPEDTQIGTLDVTFDDGASWTNLLTYDSTQMSGTDNINETLSFENISNPTAGTAKFRWQMIGGNDWWWAIDNIRISGEVAGESFAGVSDPTQWEFSTPEEPILSISVDAIAINENGGSATGTVSRNLDTTDALTVTLVSSDTGEATVPTEVTIPAGQASTTFTITAVDDTELDRNQLVDITASAANYSDGVTTITVLDDELPIIVSTIPADDATDVNYLTDFEATFDVNVKKGHGRLYIVNGDTGMAEQMFDVNDPAVTISGATLSFPSQGKLFGETDYYVMIDDGAILDDSTNVFTGATLLVENFDVLPLGPAVTESNGDGTDWTDTPPLGFTTSESLTGEAGADEWAGWSFADKTFWSEAEGDGRDRFTSASGNVAVADPGAWADVGSGTRSYEAFLVSPGIDLSGVDANSVSLEFDSSYVDNSLQVANIEVSYNNGASWSFVDFIDANTPDERKSYDISNPSSGTLKFRFHLQLATDDGYWAIDNILVTGDTQGLPYTGIQDDTTWNFTTAAAGTVTVTTASPSVAEDAGTLTGTVTRNLDTTGDLVVDLASSDTTEATVPAQVTIPDGQASVDFTITILDDNVADGTQPVTISATPPADYFNVPATFDVLDDDVPVITSYTPADDSTGVAVDATFKVSFDQEVKKGNGFIHILRVADGKTGLSLDVNSPNVTVIGDEVTIFPTMDLGSLTDYYIAIDDGAILGTAEGVNEDVTLLKQDFEVLPLRAAVDESGGDGTDFTLIPPSGYTIDNSGMVGPGITEWDGWSFADKDFWAQAGEQDRASFTLGTGTVAVADSDEFDDVDNDTEFNSLLFTPTINLADVSENSVSLEFDSSFLAEGDQRGFVDVTFDGGETWTNVLTLDTQDERNNHYSFDIANPAGGQMRARFSYSGDNNWWWAIDNLMITGDVNGLPFGGISTSDTTQWNVTTADTSTYPQVTTLDPADDAADVSVASNLTITFDQDVRKGSGFIHVLRAEDGKLGSSIDVNSSDVSISGGIVTIDIPADLLDGTEYTVQIDNGALLSTSTTLQTGVTLLSEDFESLPLGPAIWEDVGDGTDFTTTPPSGYTVDNSAMPSGGFDEWDGWSFADKEFWFQSDDQGRTDFTLGTGTVAIADSDEFDDGNDPERDPGTGDRVPFNSLFHTPQVSLADVQADSVKLEFDSSFRPEGSQIGLVDVSYDGGTTWTNLLTLDTEDHRNTRYSLDVPNGAADATAEFRFSYTGANNWWWAIDNIKVVGDVNGLPAIGLDSAEDWTFTTEDRRPTPTALTPADDSTGVAADANLTMTFDQNVRKGNGFIHILNADDGKIGQSIDVNSAAVTIAGAVVTIDPPSDLADGSYYVSFDEGAILSEATTLQPDATLLWQDFETLALGAAVDEPADGGDPVGDGTDFTLTPPEGYTVDNSEMATEGVTEWRGWSFADKDFWDAAGGQDRGLFDFGSGTVAIADSDEFDDLANSGPFNSKLHTVPINLGDVVANTVTLEFDSDFLAEGDQEGRVEVTFDGGTTWNTLLTLNPNDRRNRHVELDVANPDTGSMEFRFAYTGSNNWWWAIDNIKVTGDVNGLASPGIANTDSAAWNFSIGADDTTPPVIETIIVASSTWDADYIDAVDGGGDGAGNGLGYALTVGEAPLPWANLDLVYVQFSEDVADVPTSMVELLDSDGQLSVSSSYDSSSYVATLTLPTLGFSKLRLGVSDEITDEAGNALDGDQSGEAGGVFDFRFDVLPGDGDRSGRVDGSDLAVFSAGFLSSADQENFGYFGDWDGSGRVDGSDLAVFSANFLNAITNLGDPAAPFATGGGSSNSNLAGNKGSAYSGGVDSYFGALGDNKDDEDDEELLYF